MIKEDFLRRMYLNKKKSAEEISRILKCSPRTVRYWMAKYKISTRSISEAIYCKHNPKGDPFKLKPPETLEEAKLYGLGMGLYWGEGTKANPDSIRLGNSDPLLISKFIKFLFKFLGIKKKDLKFWLQIFSDINPEEAIAFWVKKLKIKPEQITKPTITISGSIGTYRKKSNYGVLSVYYNNKKARNLIIDLLASVAQW